MVDFVSTMVYNFLKHDTYSGEAAWAKTKKAPRGTPGCAAWPSGLMPRAVVCRALGGEMLAEAPRYVLEALGLYRCIKAPTEEDLELLAELEEERRANK